MARTLHRFALLHRPGIMKYDENPDPHIIQPGEPSHWEEQVPRVRADVVSIDMPGADAEANE